MISELLPTGKDNAVSTKHLCDQTGLNERTLRAVVAEERISGAVILSCNKGYFLPQSRAEVEECVRTLETKGKSILYALKSARRYLRNTANEAVGQISL